MYRLMSLSCGPTGQVDIVLRADVKGRGFDSNMVAYFSFYVHFYFLWSLMQKARHHVII